MNNPNIEHFRDKVEKLILGIKRDGTRQEEYDDNEEYEDDEEDDEEYDDEVEDDEEYDDEEDDEEGDEVADDDEVEDDEYVDEVEEPGSDEDYNDVDDTVENNSKNWDEEDKNIYILSEQEPTSIQMFTHNPHYYLTDAQTRFSPDIEILDSNPINYFLYIYILCNNTNFDPYLACLLQYDEPSKSYTFPKIKYEPISLKDGETHDVYIKNMCYEIIYPLFQIEEIHVTSEFIEHTKDCFKGSMLYDGMEHGYLCFNAEKFIRYLKGDYKNLSEHFHKKEEIPGYTWACMYEIVTTNRVNNVAIHSDVIDTFREYDWLRDIKNKQNENTELPMMLYGCKIKNNKIDQTMTDSEKKKFLPPVSNFSIFKKVRFFTNELTTKQGAFQMPRYIVFLGKLKSIEDDVTKKTVFEDKEMLNINSVTFKLENVALYGVFSSDCMYKF